MELLNSKLTRRDLLLCIPLMAIPSAPLKATIGASNDVSTLASTGDRSLGSAGQRIGIALGAGGANGLAHIAMLEVLDELEIRPHRIAGASIGAVIGAMYASGMSASKIRDLANQAFMTKESDSLYDLLSAQALNWLELVELELGNGGLLDSQKILSHFYQSIEPRDFSDLEIRMDVVAGDLWKREQVILNSGKLLPAVQASMAIPGVFRPVVMGNRVLIDGGTVNPVPWDLLFEDCDIVVGIDVSGVRSRPGSAELGYFEILFNSIEVMQKAIIDEKLRNRRPDIFIAPEVRDVRALEFY
ncbi:MAG: patatin-like phospholipase family protein, partial [Lysobacterales bacterium]